LDRHYYAGRVAVQPALQDRVRLSLEYDLVAVDQRCDFALVVLAVFGINLARHDKPTPRPARHLYRLRGPLFRRHAGEEQEMVRLLAMKREAAHVYGVVGDASKVVAVDLGHQTALRPTDRVEIAAIAVPNAPGVLCYDAVHCG